MSRGGIDERILGEGDVALGGNEHETVFINVSANSKVEKGTILKRGNAPNEVIIATQTVNVAETDSDSVEQAIGLLVNPFDIENKTNSAKAMSLRAIVSGPVRADVLKLDGGTPNQADFDSLRHSSIIPLRGNDISRTE